MQILGSRYYVETMLPKKNKGRSEYNATPRPSTPRLHDNALRRENGAERLRCRVRNGQGSSPGAWTQKGEPQRRLQEDSAVRGGRRHWRQSAELLLGNSSMSHGDTQDIRDVFRLPDPDPGTANNDVPEPPAARPLATHTTKRISHRRCHEARRRATHGDRRPGPPPRHPCPKTPPPIHHTTHQPRQVG